MEMENQTMVTEFILLGLSNDPHLQIFLFLVFLVIYVITLLGNVMIILVISSDPQLHTPMYFFLFHLSFVDICYSSVTIPKMLQNFLAERKTISANGCFAQNFFFLLSGCTEGFMLSVMAYDRHAAICDPLHYVNIMNKRVCSQLVAGAWTMSILFALINTLFLLNVSFCGPNEVNHFSCELPLLLALSCTETFTNEVVLLMSVVIFGLSSFIPILVSYIHIISTILRIRSAEGRRKVFSTCSSHLTVVGLLYLTALCQYMKPRAASSVVLDELFSIQYSILTPMLNPIIYSLKNKEVKMALGKIYSSRVSDVH
ncbi:olfactory receptor 8S1-like [Emydura macquarii macquarii]|uniref:olfactory receptor 8S1-like n=1 Tax=Emydura macquarii macquarii TaxID=1129001 RepID=UPI00352BB8E0